MQTNPQLTQSCEPDNQNMSATEPHCLLMMQDIGGGRVSLYVEALVSAKTAAAIKAVIDEEDQQSSESLSIDMLATELDVTRRTVERALKDGVLVPTWHKGKRARFSR